MISAIASELAGDGASWGTISNCVAFKKSVGCECKPFPALENLQISLSMRA